MKLTAKARMAVKALADIAAYGHDAPVSLADIAARHTMSVPFLEQVFAKLRRAGLVESRRGVGGGYLLAKPAAKISVAEVVCAIDEEIRSTGCQPGTSVGCTGGAERCLTHGLWYDLDRVIEDYLAGVTLADIAAKAKVPSHV